MVNTTTLCSNWTEEKHRTRYTHLKRASHRRLGSIKAGGLDEVEIGIGLSPLICPKKILEKKISPLKYFYVPKADQIHTLRMKMEEIYFLKVISARNSFSLAGVAQLV